MNQRIEILPQGKIYFSFTTSRNFWYGSGFDQITQTIKAIDRLKMQTIWLWPNIDAGTDDFSKALEFTERIKNQNLLISIVILALKIMQ